MSNLIHVLPNTRLWGSGGIWTSNTPFSLPSANDSIPLRLASQSTSSEGRGYISLPQWGKGDRLRWMRCRARLTECKGKPQIKGEVFACAKVKLLRSEVWSIDQVELSLPSLRREAKLHSQSELHLQSKLHLPLWANLVRGSVLPRWVSTKMP